MLFFDAAQPALLYLVPLCLGASVITGLMRGELLTVLYPYDETDEETDKSEDAKSKEAEAPKVELKNDENKKSQ